MATDLITVGHGTASRAEFTRLLHGAGVNRLVDVRRYPGSRAYPHVSRDALTRWLPAAGVNYRWEERLGGRRRLPAESPDKTETAQPTSTTTVIPGLPILLQDEAVVDLGLSLVSFLSYSGFPNVTSKPISSRSEREARCHTLFRRPAKREAFVVSVRVSVAMVRDRSCAIGLPAATAGAGLADSSSHPRVYGRC